MKVTVDIPDYLIERMAGEKPGHDGQLVSFCFAAVYCAVAEALPTNSNEVLAAVAGADPMDFFA